MIAGGRDGFGNAFGVRFPLNHGAVWVSGHDCGNDSLDAEQCTLNFADAHVALHVDDSKLEAFARSIDCERLNPSHEIEEREPSDQDAEQGRAADGPPVARGFAGCGT